MTIWLRGGIYNGTFTSTIYGTASLPIVVRGMPGERATIDGGTSSYNTLTTKGAYVHYRDFEITKSDPKRATSATGSNPTGISRGSTTGIYASGRYNKFINLVIHDDGVGFGFWSAGVGAEIYGCLVYNNGWDAPDRGHGHGIYTQNQTGTKYVRDTMFFNNYGNGVQLYGSSAAYLNYLHFEGNVAFNNGLWTTDGFSYNFILGGGSIAENPKLIDNHTYFSATANSKGNKLGYMKGTRNAVVTGNYFASETPLTVESSITPTVTDNTMYGFTSTIAGQFPSNSFFRLNYAMPENKVVVRPNAYEPGRANIVVYNWEQRTSVDVDVSNVLSPGANFEIRNVQDFYGAPVMSGTYNGGWLTLPLDSLRVAPPIGNGNAVKYTGTEFNAFVVITK